MDMVIGLIIGGIVGFASGVVIMWKSLRTITGVTEAMNENGRIFFWVAKKLGGKF